MQLEEFKRRKLAARAAKRQGSGDTAAPAVPAPAADPAAVAATQPSAVPAVAAQSEPVAPEPQPESPVKEPVAADATPEVPDAASEAQPESPVTEAAPEAAPLVAPVAPEAVQGNLPKPSDSPEPLPEAQASTEMAAGAPVVQQPGEGGVSSGAVSPAEPHAPAEVAAWGNDFEDGGGWSDDEGAGDAAWQTLEEAPYTTGDSSAGAGQTASALVPAKDSVSADAPAGLRFAPPASASTEAPVGAAPWGPTLEEVGADDALPAVTAAPEPPFSSGLAPDMRASAPEEGGEAEGGQGAAGGLDVAGGSELEQWQTYASELEARVTAAEEDAAAWAEAHQELSEAAQQSEAALEVRRGIDPIPYTIGFSASTMALEVRRGAGQLTHCATMCCLWMLPREVRQANTGSGQHWGRLALARRDCRT